jgi:CcmD family protein
MKIAVLASFLGVLVVFFFVARVPVSLTADEVAKAVSEAISESGVPMDEEVLEQAVQLSVAKLEQGQSTRLKYLASAYLVIWLVFVLYVLQLERQQQTLDKRLAQLETEK